MKERQTIVKLLGNDQKPSEEFPRLRTYTEVSSVPKITGTKRAVQAPKVVFVKNKGNSKNIEEVKTLYRRPYNPWIWALR